MPLLAHNIRSQIVSDFSKCNCVVFFLIHKTPYLISKAQELILWEILYVLFPPIRKILNDLSSDAPAVPRIEEEKVEEDSSAAAAAATPAITTVTVPTPIYQTSSGQYSGFQSAAVTKSSLLRRFSSCPVR